MKEVFIMTWLEIVQDVKKAVAKQKPGYSKEKWINVTSNGKTFSTRTDCSGVVTTMLKVLGVLSTSANATSKSFAATQFPELEKNGFRYIPFTTWESLKTGDIIAVDGHVEIFAYIKDGKNYVFNTGSTSAINSEGPTVSSHEKYTTVWRKNDPGKLTGDLKGCDYPQEKSETVTEKTEEKPEQKETTKTETSKFPYIVRVKITNLIIRTNAGTTYPPVKKNGKIQYTGAGLFTIVAEKTDKTGKKWGLLKSYQKGKNGWISLEYTTKQ